MGYELCQPTDMRVQAGAGGPPGCCSMRRGGPALLALLLLAARLHGGAATMAAPDEDSDEEESDSAPFMVVVETEGGQWRCAGALVSLRTAVSSAWCARGGGTQADQLWALAAAAACGQAARRDGARRVARVAVAGTTERSSWGGALLDLAVLELEAPFGSGARARPILMATATGECSAPAACHVVRAQWSGERARLRIVDAALVAEKACAPLVPYWALARERALCVEGPELCRGDWGAGVVCGGKLCGVVSRSMRPDAPAAAAVQRAMPQCGHITLAQSVPRWRRFLHCAHTLRACGRGACADLCIEHQLLDMELLAGASPDPAGAVNRGSTTALIPYATAPPEGAPPTTPSPPTRTAPPAPPPPVPVSPFEPNRPDFRGPSRSSAVTRRPGWLKAGEYGDNGADYGADEPVPCTLSAPTRSHTPEPDRRAPPAPRLQAAHNTSQTPPALQTRARSLRSDSRIKRPNRLIIISYLILQVTFL